MLSEPRSRKRMQLYEQDPGLRQTAVASGVFEAQLENGKLEVWHGRPYCKFIFLCCFISGARRKPCKYFSTFERTPCTVQTPNKSYYLLVFLWNQYLPGSIGLAWMPVFGWTEYIDLFYTGLILMKKRFEVSLKNSDQLATGRNQPHLVCVLVVSLLLFVLPGPCTVMVCQALTQTL